MIGKRIQCHLDTAHGDKTPFIADVKPGRHEGEVYLSPVDPEFKPEGYKPPPRGYTPKSVIYIQKIVGEGDATPPSNLRVLADQGLASEPAAQPPPPPSPPIEASPGTVPMSEEQLQDALAKTAPAEPTLPEAAAAPADPVAQQPELAAPEPQQPELTDERRLSQNPVSTETRRRRGRGGPAEHGAAAAQADEFVEKP